MRLIDPLRGDLLIRSTFGRYAFAIAGVALAFGLRVLLIPWTGIGAPYVVFFAATLVTSLVGGVGPALLSLALSLPIGSAEFVLRAGYPVSQALAQAGLYAVDGLIMVYLTMLMSRRRQSLQETNRQLQHAKEERERSLIRVRETIELAPDAYFLADLDGRYTDVNQAACRLLGYQRDELIGKTIYDIIPAEETPRLQAERRAMLDAGAVSTSEWLLKRKDDTLVPTEVSANILPDGRWQAFVRDISERRRIEVLRQVYVSLLDNSPDFIGIADPSGKPMYVNAAGRRMVGLAPDFPVEETQIQDYYPPDLCTFATDVILRTMVERGQWSGETEFQNLQTHERIPVSDTHFTIRDASGEHILGYATITRDISEARRIAEKLRLSEAKFSAIVSIAADAIITVDRDQRILIFNEGAEEIFGYTSAEVIGASFDRLIPERFRAVHNEHFARFAASPETARKMGERKDIFGLRKNGEEFPAEASISKVTVGGTTFFSVVLRDVTYHKNIEAALRRAVTARDEVLRIVAHDLRNPLNTIMMQAELLERLGPEPERRDQTPRLVITRSARRMEHLIRDLLDVALVEAGQLKVEQERLSAAELARDALEMQKQLASSAGLELRLDVEHALRAVWGDRNRLLQVFENLIGNAVKFTDEGGRITIGARAGDHRVEFFVADTGCGIPPEGVAHIFDPFWQASHAGGQGAGLGLPITRGIVEAHGGQIRVESTLGRGTTFFFTIPTAPAERSRSDMLKLPRRERARTGPETSGRAQEG
jgi:PAS domain S-box-containing protein